eukprot:SAG11_NODE_227_length_11995_cov_4.386601_4_plen_161_part_00
MRRGGEPSSAEADDSHRLEFDSQPAGGEGGPSTVRRGLASHSSRALCGRARPSTKSRERTAARNGERERQARAQERRCLPDGGWLDVEAERRKRTDAQRAVGDSRAPRRRRVHAARRWAGQPVESLRCALLRLAPEDTPRTFGPANRITAVRACSAGYSS